MQTPGLQAAVNFSRALLHWRKSHGRRSLPWQNTQNAYYIWLSEIMLQQTQVATVIPYYQRFLLRFPGIADLAAASEDEVMALWAGLGYYARARNLHKAAKKIVAEFAGVFPCEFADVLSLPGIGRSTAGAILAFSRGQRHPILDGNVKRVLTRHFAIPGFPGDRRTELRLWALAERLTPHRQVAEYTQAIMDLGAMICTRKRPVCEDCPVKDTCMGRAQGAPTQYPAPRPRRKRPSYHTRMPVIENAQGEILLVRRPPTGIWGGLWCLPQIDDACIDLTQWIRKHLGVIVEPQGTLTPVAHGFTHYELVISPVVCTHTGWDEEVSEGSAIRWYDPACGEAHGALLTGLPAAVEKIFQRLKLPQQTTL